MKFGFSRIVVTLLVLIASGRVQAHIAAIIAVIVANLPYLNQAMLEASPEEVHLHEPHGALMSDANDGLNLYRELIDHLHRHRHVLPKDRILVFEIDPRQGSSATKMARDLAPHATFSLHHDLASRPRVVVLEGV